MDKSSWTNIDQDIQIILSEEVGGEVGEFRISNLQVMDPSEEAIERCLKREDTHPMEVKMGFCDSIGREGRIHAVCGVDDAGFMWTYDIFALDILKRPKA